MLASKWEERNETMFPMWVQPKYDGIRVGVESNGYGYTRSLKPVRNEVLQSMIRRNADVLIGLDGEMIVGEPTAPDCYVRTSSAVMSFTNDDIENVKYYVFDIWSSEEVYDTRLDILYQKVDSLPSWVEVAPASMIYDMQMLREYEEKKLAEGHEGLILRNRYSVYKHGRGTPKEGQLIKLKRFEDAEGEIIAVHEFMHNSNEAKTNELGHTERSGHKENLIPMNKLGAIEVKIHGWQSESVRIGTGFTDAQRVELWHQNLIGKTAKYKFFAVGTKDAPRFPVYLGMRDKEDMSPPDDRQGSLF
jgi:DNA ligase-1